MEIFKVFSFCGQFIEYAELIFCQKSRFAEWMNEMNEACNQRTLSVDYLIIC